MPAATGAVAAWVLYISVACGPYEPLTVLPTEVDCQALALTAWSWEVPGYFGAPATRCQPLGMPPPAVDANQCVGY